MQITPSETPPDTSPHVEGADPKCPECGHDRTARKPLGVANWLRRHLGMRPLAAECAYDVDSVESEMGLPGPCGCRNPAHGS